MAGIVNQTYTDGMKSVENKTSSTSEIHGTLLVRKNVINQAGNNKITKIRQIYNNCASQ